MDLTFEQLPKAVGQILEALERIEKLLNLNEVHTKDIDEPGSLLNVQQAAKFLNVRTSSIYKLTCRREIPHLKQGKRLYFVKSELFEWVSSNRVKTASEIKQEAMNFLIKSARRKLK
jgi:excisionase family DNA binding protein